MIQLRMMAIPVLLTLGCAAQPEVPKPIPANDQVPPGNQVVLPPQPPEATTASNWTELTIQANSAKTTVSTAAHFATDRNACGKDAYGVMGLDDWNSLANHLNVAVLQEPASTPYCVATPDSYPYMNDSVVVALTQGKRTLYELKDGQICSTVQDHQLSDALLADIQKVIVSADKEECAQGWGSA
jgi:hypothetical protein